MKTMKPFIAEFTGTALLLAIIASSAVLIGDMFADGSVAVVRLGNGIATGAGLYVLIVLFGPFSGAHFNPVVSVMFWRMGQISLPRMLGYWVAQFSGGIFGVWLTHCMFDLPVIQTSTTARAGTGMWVSELISALILLSVIRLGDKYNKQSLPTLVALIVATGAWFTPSTFFANPAVTVARSLTDTFVGISPESAFWFVTAEFFAVFLISMSLPKQGSVFQENRMTG